MVIKLQFRNYIFKVGIQLFKTKVKGQTILAWRWVMS